MAEELVMPNPGEKISDGDFIRLVNRAQAIILCLAAADVEVEVVDKLEIANDTLKSAMNAKLRRR